MKLLKTKKDREQFLTWIAFLEVGVFEKGKNTLETVKGKYCCLGIGCVITIPEEKLLLHTKANILLGSLPKAQPSAPKWLKRINSDVFLRKGYSLVNMNDDRGMSHPEIAKLLLELYADQLHFK